MMQPPAQTLPSCRESPGLSGEQQVPGRSVWGTEGRWQALVTSRRLDQRQPKINHVGWGDALDCANRLGNSPSLGPSKESKTPKTKWNCLSPFLPQSCHPSASPRGQGHLCLCPCYALYYVMSLSKVIFPAMAPMPSRIHIVTITPVPTHMHTLLSR